MYEVGAGFTVVPKGGGGRNLDKPVLNENIFYSCEWDKPLKVEKYKDQSQPLNEYIRENSLFNTVTETVGQGETIKLIGIGFIFVILINIFRR